MRQIRNIKEFSALAKVSTATASRVFSNDPKVKDRTASRIRKLAEKYRFRPNAVSQSAFGAKTKSIGVLLCRLTTSYFADIAQGIQEYLLPKGYLPIIISLRSMDRDFVSLRRLFDHRVEGIIACLGEESFTRKEIGEIEHFELPVVTIDSDGSRRHPLFSGNVSSDERQCGILAADHLIRNGHRNIYYAAEGGRPLKKYSRLSACRDRLEEYGIGFDDSHYYAYGASRPKKRTGNLSISEWLRDKPRPLACYAYNDNVALMIYRAAAELGWKIPDDVSVIGTADLNIAAIMSPPLTTVRQDGVETGRVAAEYILSIIRHGAKHRIAELPVELVERKSVRKQKTEQKGGV